MTTPRYRAILTGAGGGIGSAIAVAIAPSCELLLVVGRDAARLAKLEQKIARPGLRIRIVLADLMTVAGRDAVARAAVELPGGVNLLINNAGVSEFSWFADQSEVARILGVNALAPMLLTRSLPSLQLRLRRRSSMSARFGYLGYSAAPPTAREHQRTPKRCAELADGLVVLHFAPRATRIS
jgi:short-subunit dehydrogenase